MMSCWQMDAQTAANTSAQTLFLVTLNGSAPEFKGFLHPLYNSCLIFAQSCQFRSQELIGGRNTACTYTNRCTSERVSSSGGQILGRSHTHTHTQRSSVKCSITGGGVSSLVFFVSVLALQTVLPVWVPPTHPSAPDGALGPRVHLASSSVSVELSPTTAATERRRRARTFVRKKLGARWPRLQLKGFSRHVNNLKIQTKETLKITTPTEVFPFPLRPNTHHDCHLFHRSTL